MDLFLSWSTKRSKELASIFNDWIKNVIPQLNVYYSPNDIQPGERWSDSIKGGLEGNPMGIFFIVEENIVQPWINFEAGAISNKVGNSNVIPLLHELEPSIITGPLTQFQAISYNKNDIRKLIFLINDNLNDIRQIDQAILNDIFDKWYPEFEEKYNEFKKENPAPENNKEINSGILDESGQISEILSIVRSLERNNSNIPLSRDIADIKDKRVNIIYSNSKDRECTESSNYYKTIRKIKLEKLLNDKDEELEELAERLDIEPVALKRFLLSNFDKFS